MARARTSRMPNRSIASDAGAGLDTMPVSRSVLNVHVDATMYADAAERIVTWSDTAQGRYVCVANVHMVMEAHDDPSFRTIVNGADVVTPDGMPLVWALRMFGVRQASRV